MINGVHTIIYSKNPDADREFFRDVLGFTHLDIGGGWLLFEMPPSEVAFHPSDNNDVHELYFMCDDIEAFITEMRDHEVSCAAVQRENWGLLTRIALPGGGRVGVYQPLHERAC